MRISTNTIFESGSSRLSELQASLVRQQEQIATGRRMLTPADDPVAAARAMEVTQSQSINTQYATNRQNAKDSLSQEEAALQSVTTLLQDVKTLVVGSGDGAFNDTDRLQLVTELQGKFSELLGLANSKDGTDAYLFAGYQTTAQPFAQSATGALYSGDQGHRLLQVGPSQQLDMSDAGSTVFENGKTGNGTFVTAASGANTGAGIIGSGSIVNSALLTGHNYSINFNVVAGAMTYDVVDSTTATTLSAGNAYVSGQSISFDGLQLDVTGSPADNDQFTVAPSVHQSVFTTLRNLINVLSAPATGSVGQARLTNGLSAANNNVSNALDNVLTVRASIGARLNSIESLDNNGSDKDIQYSQTLATLQDLDYTKAITQLTQQQTTLTAAQQSFVKISGLSLFNYL